MLNGLDIEFIVHLDSGLDQMLMQSGQERFMELEQRLLKPIVGLV